MKPRLIFVLCAIFAVISAGCSTAPRGTDIVIPPPPPVRY